MRIRYTFLLSAKYLYGHFRRYVFLLAALVFGFAVITVMTSLEEGMSQSVYRAAENHYAGHLFVLGFEKTGGGHIVVEKDREIREAVREAGLNPAKIVRRTNYFSKGVLYFNGIAVRQKYVYGVDWKNERENFDRLNYSSGGPANLEGKNWIIISSAVSDRLHARMGDEIILEVLTRTGQKNTGVFVVKGIVEDTSIFGYYKCFVDRRRLNSLLRYKEDEYSSLGLYFESLNGLWEKNERLYSALEKRITMGPRIHDKEDLTYQMDSHWEDVLYLTFPLHVYVSQVAELLTSLEIISYFLYILMILIILMSVLVTYQLILRERAVEVATLRALGLTSGAMQGVLVLEIIFVFVLAVVMGLGLSQVVLWLLSQFSFESIPGFGIFLTGGRLKGVFSLPTVATNVSLIFLIIFPAAWIPAFRSTRSGLAHTLSGGNA